jgi:hypothetical protein
MYGKIRQYRPPTFIDYVKLVEGLRAQPRAPLWFRGCRKAKYRLLPSMYRHDTRKTAAQLTAAEQRVMDRFRARSLPYGTRDFATDPWELLFCMQHHGVPTRLLDWSESPLVGLYFALMPASRNPGRASAVEKSDAAVWILDPVAWNQHGIRMHDKAFDGGILSYTASAADSYKPGEDISKMYEYPVAIHGCYNSPRIVAQRGVFTVFGRHIRPMETQHRNGRFDVAALTKVVIRATRLAAYREALLSNGLTESAVFPDLDGLAAELRREESS